MGMTLAAQALLGLKNTWTKQQLMDGGIASSGNLVMQGGNASGAYSYGNLGSAQYIGSGPSGPLAGGPLTLPAATVGNSPSYTSTAVASGTVYQNTTKRYETLYLPTYVTVSGTAGTIAFALGTSSTPSAIWTDDVLGSTSSTAAKTFVLRIPPDAYWSITATGVTLASATMIEE